MAKTELKQMTDTASNNKRIAKNTVFLFIRMLFVLGVTLYTSRVILQVLGVEDYGIYNVVGGVVTMLSFITNSLSGASSRFITYALGQGDKNYINKTFSSILFVHYALAVLIFVLAETLGLWFVLEKLVIPIERQEAAMWVYQCSVVSVIVSIISVPYNSLIIAHERMSAFAYISIIEVVLKLVIVWTLIYIPFDQLIVYAVILALVQILIRILYTVYCKKHFEESVVRAKYYKQESREIFFYSCWTMNGYLAIAGYTQGINILLNLFFGPVVNAARGIAVQVQAACMSLVQNFLTAIRPQIIKSYANSDLVYMHTLVISATKYGYYLMLIIITPLLLCVESILELWLGIVPDHTVGLVKIMLLSGLLQPLGSAMIGAIHATGDIKKFQIYEGSSLLLVVPIAYVLLKCCKISPEMVMLVYLCVELFTQCIRVWIVLPKVQMSYKRYIKEAILPLILPTLCMLWAICFVHVGKDVTFVMMLIYAVISILYILLSIIFVGLSSKERKQGIEYLRIKLKK